jgi:hypothetical protein
MKLLRLAVEKERWDLAAHTIVLATARLLQREGNAGEKRRREEKRCPKGQSKR